MVKIESLYEFYKNNLNYRKLVLSNIKRSTVIRTIVSYLLLPLIVFIGTFNISSRIIISVIIVDLIAFIYFYIDYKSKEKEVVLNYIKGKNITFKINYNSDLYNYKKRQVKRYLKRNNLLKKDKLILLENMLRENAVVHKNSMFEGHILTIVLATASPFIVWIFNEGVSSFNDALQIWFYALGFIVSLYSLFRFTRFFIYETIFNSKKGELKFLAMTINDIILELPSRDIKIKRLFRNNDSIVTRKV